MRRTRYSTHNNRSSAPRGLLCQHTGSLTRSRGLSRKRRYTFSLYPPCNRLNRSLGEVMPGRCCVLEYVDKLGRTKQNSRMDSNEPRLRSVLACVELG